ncbi:hypothetical protein VCBJG01_3433 [Vibrio cholerae BJG-01]|nr:hypothetical protein VCBJG01_3433 [Vibrio cholerae BJG-01]
MLAQWHTERCQETKAKLKKKTPLSLSLVGFCSHSQQSRY